MEDGSQDHVCQAGDRYLHTDGGELLPSSRLLSRNQTRAKTMESDFQSEAVIQSQNKDQVCPAT